jgi:DNA-binding transcriptional ArsR family regulator
MQGVRTVRFVTVLAVTAILAGSWMINFPNEENFDEINEEISSLDMALAESDSEDTQPVLEREEKEGESQSNTPSRLIAGGAGALGSLALGSIFFEVMRVSVLIALVSPLLARMKKNREDLLTRGRLLGFLEANPGIHFSALRDGLGLANGVTAYHLHTLESAGQVISWRDGKLRRYAVSSLTQEEVSRIKNPIIGTRLAILEVLSGSGNIGMSGRELQEKLEISRQLLSHHLMELRNGDYVEAASDARRPKWRLSGSGLDVLVSSREISRIEAAA